MGDAALLLIVRQRPALPPQLESLAAELAEGAGSIPTASVSACSAPAGPAGQGGGGRSRAQCRHPAPARLRLLDGCPAAPGLCPAAPAQPGYRQRSARVFLRRGGPGSGWSAERRRWACWPTSPGSWRGSRSSACSPAMPTWGASRPRPSPPRRPARRSSRSSRSSTAICSMTRARGAAFRVLPAASIGRAGRPRQPRRGGATSRRSSSWSANMPDPLACTPIFGLSQLPAVCRSLPEKIRRP